MDISQRNKQAYQSLMSFFQSGTKLLYSKGESIVHAGDEPRGVYYIIDGYVKAFAITKYGEENLLIIRQHDDIFPLIWVFTNLHRDITYKAMSDTTVLRVAKSDFLKFIDDNISVYPALLELAMSAYLLHSERVMNLEYRTVSERVAMFLITTAERFGKAHPDGQVEIIAPIRRQDIAASINASRESTSRALSSLVRKQLIGLNGASIYITDLDGLRALL